MALIRPKHLIELMIETIQGIRRNFERICDLKQSRDGGQDFIKNSLRKSLQTMTVNLYDTRLKIFINEYNDENGIFIHFLDGIKNYSGGYGEFTINILSQYQEKTDFALVMLPYSNVFLYTKLNDVGVYLDLNGLERKIRLSPSPVNLLPAVTDKMNSDILEFLTKNKNKDIRTYGSATYALYQFINSKSNIAIIDEKNPITVKCIEDIVEASGAKIEYEKEFMVIRKT